MKVKIIHILSACVVLSACHTPVQLSEPERQLFEISDWPFFSVQSPEQFREHIVRDDGSVALTTFDTSSIQRVAPDYAVTLFPAIETPCSETVTGASTMQQLPGTDGNTVWGKVDFWEIYGMDYDPNNEPKCRPFVGGSAYALCSSQNDRTIVVCVEQAIDNPSLAEEIFRTFRWTQ